MSKISNMQISIIILACFLLLLIILLSIELWKQPSVESFETVPLSLNPATKKIANGYYQIDETKMALIPYGYKLDPNDQYKIIPKTKAAAYSALSSPSNTESPDQTNKVKMPALGVPLPAGYYKLSDVSLSILPPNMSPDVSAIDFTTSTITTPAKMLIYYNNSYVSDTQYYNKKFKPTRYPSTLPPDLYYVDPQKTLISFLPFGKIPNASNGYGMIDDPDANLSPVAFSFGSASYREIENNYDTQFHDDVETIQKNNSLYDLSFGQVRVLDPSGKMIILPNVKAQGLVTFYNPGDYPFGAATYVPNYEDSVYLSNVGYRTRFGHND
jgi:hypothetical protein